MISAGKGRSETDERWELAAQEQIKKLKTDKGLAKQHRAVSKAVRLLQQNPQHPGLNTHKWQGARCVHGQTLFEAYAENKTPAAFRVWFCYSPAEKRDTLTIEAVGPHP